MANSFQPITEKTPQPLAQVLLAERLNHVIQEQSEMKDELDKISQTFIITKWFQGLIIPAVVIALIKAFLF